MPRRPGQRTFRTRAEHVRATLSWERWRGGPLLRHGSSIHPGEIDRLADLRADILVTYEAPGYHPHGFTILDTLAQSMGAQLVVYGHHHDALDSLAHWGSQGFRSFGVGLHGITAIDPEGRADVIVPGERDHAGLASGAPLF